MNLQKTDSDDVFRRFNEDQNLESGSEYSVEPSEMTHRQQEPTKDANIKQ